MLKFNHYPYHSRITFLFLLSIPLKSLGGYSIYLNLFGLMLQISIEEIWEERKNVYSLEWKSTFFLFVFFFF